MHLLKMAPHMTGDKWVLGSLMLEADHLVETAVVVGSLCSVLVVSGVRTEEWDRELVRAQTVDFPLMTSAFQEVVELMDEIKGPFNENGVLDLAAYYVALLTVPIDQAWDYLKTERKPPIPTPYSISLLEGLLRRDALVSKDIRERVRAIPGKVRSFLFDEYVALWRRKITGALSSTDISRY
jgi:hypothetical protein